MTDNNPTFNIFGNATKENIKVGYISTDRGFISGVSICDANDYAKLNPGTIFIFRNRKEIRYIDINQVNKLTTDDLLSETGEDCSGIKVDSECTDNTSIEVFGGGGLGVLANPIIGKDGSVLAVDMVQGGFGYKYAPSAKVKDPCGIGAGAALRVVMVDGTESDEVVEYDDEEDFENYEICDGNNNVGFGRRYSPTGKDIGEWNPNLYLDDGTLSFNEQLQIYTDFLLQTPNPWWHSRLEPPLKTTSDGKISRSKYDVYHWAWGAVPGTNDPIDNLYIKLFGRQGEPSGLKYWRDIMASGKNLNEIEAGMKTFPEWKQVCEGECKPVMPERTYLGGQYYEVDLTNFMNSYAISPVPMSNVVPSDFGGKQHYFEWEIDFPHDGEYVFKFQCDNQGSLYVDGEKKGEYVLGSGGAGGNVLSPPEKTKVSMTQGFHTIRIDIFNGQVMKKVAKQDQGSLGDLTTGNKVDFKFSTNTMYANTLEIEGLDISLEKKFGDASTQVREDFSRDVEYGRVYDVKITSNNRRTGNLPATNKELIFGGLNAANNPIKVVNKKQLVLKDGHADDANATFTIDSGNATFADDGKSIIGTGVQTITLWWDDAKSKGRAINTIKLGSTTWTRKGETGSETHTLTLGGGVGIIGGENNKAVLRTKGNKVIQMEDIPGIGEAVTYDDLVLTASQGRFYGINGLNVKYTLGDRPAEGGKTSTESVANVKTIFNTADYIDKANRKLWRTRLVTTKDSAFTNRYGISPFDTAVKYESSMAGTHTIKWHNVNFPVSGEYDIGIGVDDNVTLKIGNEVNIHKMGFAVRGHGNTHTGTSLYRRFITAGSYTIVADLEQVEGGKLGYKNIAGEDAGGNPMTLAINIETAYVEEDVVDAKSWNQNPFAVALAIEAPDPPVPQEPEPVQEGRCPPNPFWSTRFPADHQWYPFADPTQRKMYRYGMSPIKPYGDENSSGGGQTYTNTWNIDAPYAGFYKLKAAADDNAIIRLDGETVLETSGVSIGTTEMVEMDEGPHVITVEVTNVAQETYDSVNKRIFSTQGWASLGTNIEEALNTNEVEFSMWTNTMYGNTLEVPDLDISYEKKFGGYPTQIRNEYATRKVEFGRVYDVKITSNNKRDAGNSLTCLEFIGLHSANKTIQLTNQKTRLCLKDGHGDDCNVSFTIDKQVMSTSDEGYEDHNFEFTDDGKCIQYHQSISDSGKKKPKTVSLTMSWNDKGSHGHAVDQIKIGNTTWTRKGKTGSETHTIQIGRTTIGGNNAGAMLRTKGENVLQMEDIPGLGEEVTYDDIIFTASQGRFFDIQGLNAKFVVDKQTKTVKQGGTGSGTVKDGVVYSGPELFHMMHSAWGPFMNKASLLMNPTQPSQGTVNYTFSNVDFPETGEYQVKFQNDAHGSLYLDGKEIVKGDFDVLAGVSDRDKANFTGQGTFKNVLIKEGKHTLTVAPTGRLGLTNVNASTLFKIEEGYDFLKDAAGFAIEIRKRMNVVRTDGTGKPVTKSWKENPVLVSAHLIPPPCPRRVRGKGAVKTIEPIVPGNSYAPPPTTGGDPGYDVLLELTNVIIEDGGINYAPEDEVVITGGPGDPVIPPFNPTLGPFGVIIDIPIPSGVWAGFTEWPDISISTSTGIGVVPTPVFTPRRTPPLADPDRLIQVTDLVGLKQTGYYDGKPYYGAVFYKDGTRYAGWYETAGQLVQVYDTLQESIDAMVTTPPSAIQRQGSDIRSNDPRLDIPGTPDNLT